MKCPNCNYNITIVGTGLGQYYPYCPKCHWMTKSVFDNKIEIEEYLRKVTPGILTNWGLLKLKNAEEFAEWLDKNGQFDGSPWMKWYDENYCKKCEPIMCHYPDSKVQFPCSWCELNDNRCKYFPEMEQAPSNKEIIKLWLVEECKE